MAFLALVTLMSSIALILSIGTHVLWVSTGRMMLAIGAVALICAYCAALSANTGWPAASCYTFAAIVGLGLGLLLSLIAYRLSVDQFLLLALAVSELVRRLAYYFEQVTGGAYGLRVTPRWGVRDQVFCYGIGLTLLACTAALQVAAKTPVGLRYRVLGSATRAGVLLGVNPNTTKLIAGAVLGLAAGIAGALYVDGIRYVHPDDLGAAVSLPALAAGIAARPNALAIDLPLLTLVLFTLRDLLRLIDVGGVARFAAHDIILGTFLIFSALKLARGAK